MTNEKDREEAKRFADRVITKYIMIKQANSRASYDGLVLEKCADIVLHRDEVLCTEAVKAERERCINAAIKWWENDSKDGGPEDIRAALSDDQEASRG